jgi:hypothetical protein
MTTQTQHAKRVWDVLSFNRPFQASEFSVN